MSDSDGDALLRVVIEPVHYGTGVETYPESDRAAGRFEPSFDRAIATWRERGWTEPRMIDDAYGRYVVELRRAD